MRILVSGATGFIGRHLVSRLSKEHEVFALVRGTPSESRTAGVSFVTDLSKDFETGSWPDHMDAVIHLAQANVPLPEAVRELFWVNTVATERLLEYAQKAGARRFVLASTGDVYGHRMGMSREADPPAPAGLYEVSKYAAELLVQAHSSDLETCILRLFRPYGPGQMNRLIPRLAENIIQQKPIRLHKGDRPHMTPIFIDDVVTAFVHALGSSPPGIFNVAGDEKVSLRELSQTIGRILKSEPLFEETGEENPDSMGDNTRMKEWWGLGPQVGLTEGLARTFRAVPSQVG